jgi:hypothetical protein
VPISRELLVRQFGAFTENGNAALLVGAGLSMAAGLPSWDELLKDLRQEARVPKRVKDLPLVAEYYIQQMPGGDKRLKAHVLSVTAERALAVEPTRGHNLLAQLPIAETWTTNYDDLLERARPNSVIIANDEDLIDARGRAGARIIKMHGGIVRNRQDGESFFVDPIVSRRDYERYAETRPRLWSLLRSTYLTKSILFLGFSFDDPNLEIMLRLSRALNSPLEHYTVLRRPTGSLNMRLHRLRVSDLERSGISVHEVADFDQLVPLLIELARRTKQAQVFVSGSDKGEASSDFVGMCRAIGSRLAELPISLSSLAGPAAGKISHAFARTLRQGGAVDAAQRVRFFFVEPSEAATNYSSPVVGSRIYTHLTTDKLRGLAMQECRAMLVVGGGERTLAELKNARFLDIPVIPVAASGGSARRHWHSCTLETSNIPVPQAQREAAARHWEALDDDDVNAVALAVQKLTAWANYLD